MRVRWLIVALIASLLGAEAGAGQAAEPAAWAGFANAWIAAHAMRLKGQAPRDRRLSCEGDLNGDGRSDVVVVYMIEGAGGGNDWTEWATALTAAPQGYAATNSREVGGKNVRGVESCRIAGAVVELQTKETASLNPRTAAVRYALRAGVLVDVPAPSPSAP